MSPQAGDKVLIISKGKSNDGCLGEVIGPAQGPDGLIDVSFDGAPFPTGSYHPRELEVIESAERRMLSSPCPCKESDQERPL